MSEREQFEAWASERDYPLGLDGDHNCYADQYTHCAWSAWKGGREPQAKELAEAQARVVLLRGVLDELVYLKDMKDHLEKLHAMGHGTDYDYYHKNKPRAWAEAREALTSTDTAAQTLREKHYEECAELFHENSIAAKAIRAAIGEKK